MSKNSFDFTATAKRVTDREVAAARLAPDYAALVKHFGMTHETSSNVVTDYARAVVIAGAHAGSTKIGLSITADMLKGSDPGADAAHRVYWKAARAVRIGLVTALGKKEGSESETDYLAAVIKAAQTALDHEITREDLLNALAPLVG
jgi:hypothetical protein